ncbi:MAG TPA: hypothetical protein PKJ56_04135 [Promineifilum sp.]|nr:hypothetical protein [Promineifilum sp.]
MTLILLTSCAKSNASSLPFIETFDNAGNWGTGEDAYSIGAVVNGVYDFKVLENDISRWVSAGKSFSDGIYEVEATPVEGSLDNGYGLIFRANPEAGDFYLFKVSADGYVWIGRYANGAEAATIIGDHWFESPAVLRGLNATNKLKVQAEAGNLIFYVNDQEVGRVTDNTLTKGDVGMLVQTLGGGGVRVLFDNLSVKPLP